MPKRNWPITLADFVANRKLKAATTRGKERNMRRLGKSLVYKKRRRSGKGKSKVHSFGRDDFDA